MKSFTMCVSIVFKWSVVYLEINLQVWFTFLSKQYTNMWRLTGHNNQLLNNLNIFSVENRQHVVCGRKHTELDISTVVKFSEEITKETIILYATCKACQDTQKQTERERERERESHWNTYCLRRNVFNRLKLKSTPNLMRFSNPYIWPPRDLSIDISSTSKYH